MKNKILMTLNTVLGCVFCFSACFLDSESYICGGELYLASGEGYLVNVGDCIDPETGEVLEMDEEWIARTLYMDKNKRIILSVELHKLDEIVDFLVY